MPSIQVFGDSIAHGGRDLDRGGWPLRIRRHMRLHGLGDAVYVQARSGDTSFDLCNRVPTEIALRGSETVMIAIGTNDAQVLGDAEHPRVTDEEFAHNLDTLIRVAKRHARWVVLVVPTQVSSVPRPGPRPILGTRLERFAGILSQLARDHGCWLIDLRTVLDDSCRPDGVHPDSAGHARIAEAVWAGLLPTGCLGEAAADIPPLTREDA